MRILNIHGVNDVRLDPTESPRPGSLDVVIKMKACGICGSDLSYIKMGGVNRKPGAVTALGHEAAGEIIAIGESVEDISIGQRVIVNPMNTPGLIGNGGPEGAFTERLLVREARLGDNLYSIPADVSYDVAALAEPLAVALHGVNRAEVKSGDKVAVFGCGPIGLGLVLWLVERGVRNVVAIDIAEERLERAKALGACAVINASKEDVRSRLIELHGSARVFSRAVAATEIYIDAAGAPNILTDVANMAKYHSRLVVMAAYMKAVQMDMSAMLSNEMTMTTALAYPTEMPEVVAALPRLRDRLRELISHRFPFDKVLDALRIAGTPASAKVMIEFESAGL
jgi:(R,R)-butanediol dehydrogenase / meso-butanediol dehydrogenase / diacetyl reductase